MGEPEARKLRLGALGIAVAVFVLVALGLSLIFCAFPWGLAHHLRQMK